MDMLVFQLLSLGFGVLATAAILIVLLRLGRVRGESGVSDTVRSEADRSRAHAEEQARGLRQELTDVLRGFQDSLEKRLDAGVESLRAPVAAMGQKLDADMRKLAEDGALGRDALRATIEAKLDATDVRLAASARETREALTASFKETREILTGTLTSIGEHQKERLDKLLGALEALTDRQALAQETLRQTVESRLDALRVENSAKLDEMRQTVDEKLQTELEKRLGDSFRTVSEQLERVHKGLGDMQTLAVGVGDLKKVLSNVKTRGILGEVQLGMLLEQFLSPSQYSANVQIKQGSAERVEFAIRLPGRDDEADVLMPIDAKFPQEDYIRLVEASERADVEAVAAAALALELRVKACAKTIHDKYINPPVTTETAILFLPTEGLFAEMLRRPGLLEHIQTEYRVTIAGPTTLSSLLSAFQMGFRSLALQQRSGEVWKLLSAVRTEFSNHGKVVEKLRNQLGAAANTIDQLGTRTNVMNRKLRDVEAMPQVEAQEILGLVAPEEDE
ncbi:MAG: DNA recombination protein RmuC [Rhizomicrobium sp.]|nr:DNA recombination protein RmuC [Rhizomicrobium sp.]